MMPGRLLGLLHPNTNDSQLKSSLTKSRNASSTSVTIEPEKEARVTVKDKVKAKLSKDKDGPISKEQDKDRGSSTVPAPPRRRPSIGMDALKRRSMSGRQHSDDKKAHKKSDGKATADAKAELKAAARLTVTEESPPLLLMGPPNAHRDLREEERPSALLSTKIVLDVLVPTTTLKSWETCIVCIVKHARPVEKHCHDCQYKRTELRRWQHIHETQAWKKGRHDVPLQYLFENHLPASVSSPSSIATVSYQVETIATTSEGETIKTIHPILLKRAIIPGSDKHSVRIFPPTSVVVNVNLQPVIHPIGEIPLTMNMTGITEIKKEAIRRWRLRKLNWRIEELSKMVSPACAKHAAKVGGENKGITHEDLRTIGQGELKGGWKTDWDKGDVTCEFKAAVNTNASPVCDVDAQNGFKVTHSLILELVVAEEWVPRARPTQVTPTGAARILKTQFAVLLTERMGMGIAWDMEMPPMYDDVPPAPPIYPQPQLQQAAAAAEALAVGAYEAPPSPPHYRRGSVGSLDQASLRELDILGDESVPDLGDLSLRRDTTIDRERRMGNRGLTAADLETEDRAEPSWRAAAAGRGGGEGEADNEAERDEQIGSMQ